MTDKYLVFDIWSCYGHFKKPYTTTSPLTYSIPSRTALTGIISAIIGLDKGEYLKDFTRDMAHIAVAIRQPIKKVRISENFINSKESMFKIINRTQIKVEYLKNPCYRIYFSHENEKLYNKLKSHLINHTSVYTISMGLSENIANYMFVGEYEGEKVKGNSEKINMNSIIPLDMIHEGDIDFQCGGEYFTETMPLEMKEDRQVTKYGEVLFERNAETVSARVREYVKLNGLNENISLL